MSFQSKHLEMSTVTIGFLISETYSWLGCSPDAFIFKDGKPHALLEIKCPFLGKSYPHNDENCIKSCDYLNLGNDGTLKMKERHRYYGQIQLGMAIAGVHLTYFIIYSSSDRMILIWQDIFIYGFGLIFTTN